MATIVSHLRRSVRVDEERVEHIAEWLSDSLHQHFDDLLRVICSGLVAGSVREWGGSMLAASLMGGSILLLTVGLHIGKHVKRHHENKVAIVKDSDPDYQAFIKALRDTNHTA